MVACRQIITLSLTKLCVLEAGYWLFLVLFWVAPSANRVNRSDRSTSPQSGRHRFNLATIGLQQPVESCPQWSNTLRILATITQSVRLRASDFSHRHGICNSLSRNARQCCCTVDGHIGNSVMPQFGGPLAGTTAAKQGAGSVRAWCGSQCARLHFLTQKGGAGKTTPTASLAVAAAAAGEKVIALDLDSQGSLVRWSERRKAAKCS
jgi:CobQ/CobB/MinD/ParA nucleotide binding domain